MLVNAFFQVPSYFKIHHLIRPKVDAFYRHQGWGVGGCCVVREGGGERGLGSRVGVVGNGGYGGRILAGDESS